MLPFFKCCFFILVVVVVVVVGRWQLKHFCRRVLSWAYILFKDFKGGC